MLDLIVRLLAEVEAHRGGTVLLGARRVDAVRPPGAVHRSQPVEHLLHAIRQRLIGETACTSSFSRLAQRLLALRPAHSRGHQFVTRYPKASDISSPPCLLRLLPAGAVAGWGLHPLESAALSRRTPSADTQPSR